MVQSYDSEGCSPAYNPGVGLELPLNQPEETLDEVEKRCYQGGFRVASFSGDNWGNNLDNGCSIRHHTS